MSLWALAPSPLMLGANMTDLDDWTLSLLTNDEVIRINQDPLGNPIHRISQQGKGELWMKKLRNGVAVGFFNRGDVSATVTLNLKDVGLTKGAVLRDMWKHQNIVCDSGSYSANLSPHGVLLLVAQ